MKNITLESLSHLRNLDFYDKFMYLYPADASKDTAKRRLRMFLDFVGIEDSELRERCNTFAQKAKSDVSWCEELVYSYLSYLKDQYENEKKISAGTIKNRKIVVKNLLEILKIPFDWKLSVNQYNGHSIQRRSFGSDIWVCDHCKFTGDRFFFENVRICPKNKKKK